MNTPQIKSTTKMDVKMTTTNNTDGLCVICQSTSEQPYIDIYTTQTNSSRSLLVEFISKITEIMFDRDKVWSKTLCRSCYDLILQLDHAEMQYLKLKNDFIDVLTKNQFFTKLPKTNETKIASNVDDKAEPGDSDVIEFCDFQIKSELNEEAYSRDNYTPAVSDDSDNEPLLGRSVRKKKALLDIIPDSMKVETVKCEFEEQTESSEKLEVFICRSCKLEFDTKANAAIHAFSAHRVDISKDPGIIKVKSLIGKDGKKKRGRKKNKKKSFADMASSDVEDPDLDKDWSIDKEIAKQNSRATRSSKRNQLLDGAISITQSEENPSQTTSTRTKKTYNKDLQKKLATSSVTIKKMIKPTSQSNVPSLSNPIPIIPLDGGPVGDLVIKNEIKDALLVDGSDLKVLETAKVKLEKRQYVKKQKPLLTCPQCPATFTSQTRMDLHMVKHTGTLSPYICEICGAAYKHKKACDIHVEMHKGISPWKCNLCDKIFPSKGALCRHEAIHTGTPNYQCDLCGKSFIHTSSFKMHKLSHSGLKPHSCNKCGLALMTRSHLKRHQRVHSGEKRHECTTCGKKFSERYNLYAHQKSHDSSGTQVPRQMKTHDCTVCEASFNRRYVLEKHMETAHQRVMEPGPKKTRNTMTKLLKQQALMQQQHHSGQNSSQANTTDSHDLDVKMLITKTPPVHNADSTSSPFIGESSFQHSGSNGASVHPTSLIVVTKQELPEGPVSEVSSGPSRSNNNNTSTSTAAVTVPTTAAVSSTATVGIPGAAVPSVVWQGLYQLANDYPSRMHGVDYLGRSGH